MLTTFWEPIKLSIIVTIAAGIIDCDYRNIVRIIIRQETFKGKILVETIFMLPLVLPPSVIGFLLIVVFGNQGVIGTWIKEIFGHSIIFTSYAAVIAATVVAFPLMFQTAKAGFQGVT